MAQRHKNKRPQPSGWSDAVQRRLRPEHIERISDTQVRITLPPCPDFDIEEDEVVHVWIPPDVLVRAKEPLYAGSFVIRADSYLERIQHAIQGAKDELQALPVGALLPRFLMMFFACEIVAKSLVSMRRNEGSNTKALCKKWNTKQIIQSLAHFGIDYTAESIGQLFSETKVPASEMSARQLRDNVVHRMKSVHRLAVVERYDELMPLMETFLGQIENWCQER